ncbi:MAG: tetratricopeptide repeat protein [Gemmatimonadota bacterium]
MNIFAQMRVLVVFGVLLAVVAPPAAAQDAPLRKSDIVRMLSGTTYSVDEVATIVRSNCLSFAPTERDLSDFRELGANDAVLTAVRECAEDAGQDAAAPPTPAAATPSYEVEPIPGEVTAPVDSVAVVTVLVRRGGQPYGGLEVVLEGSGEVAGNGATDRAGTSGADGRATIRVPIGTRAGRYSLEVTASGATLTGTTTLVLEALPGPPTVLVSPGSPVTYDGGSLDLPVEVADEFGNATPGAEVAVAGVPDGSVISRGTTDESGRIEMSLAAEDLQDVNRLVLSSDEGTLGEIELRFDMQASRMEFVEGTSQAGVPGEPLDDPVTVEVYDLDGDPAVNADVRFTVRNGSLDADVRRTGRDGRVSVRVTAGSDESRPVEIRARSGSADAVVSLPILSRQGVVAETMTRGVRRLEEGDAPGAVAAFERAVELEPRNANAWAGLGRALAAAGRPQEARTAYEQVLDLDPDNQEANAALDRPDIGRSVFGADFWGGSTLDSDREAGFRYAEVRINPAIEWLAFHGVFDDALNLRHPWLKRGEDDLRSFAAGVDLRWGSARRLRTTVEVGRREQPISDLAQNTFMLAQGIRLESGGELRVGGWAGRWFDRDDFVLFAEGRFPASRSLTVIPSVSYADEAGSNVLTERGLTATGRAPETELRGGLKLRIESPSGWGVEPGLAVGSVASDLSDEFEGSLLDATTRLWVRLGQVRLQGFARYQSPPGTRSFWSVALGLGFDVQAPR